MIPRSLAEAHPAGARWVAKSIHFRINDLARLCDSLRKNSFAKVPLTRRRRRAKLESSLLLTPPGGEVTHGHEHRRYSGSLGTSPQPPTGRIQSEIASRMERGRR